MKRFSFDLVAAGVVFLAVIIVPLIVTTVLAQSPDSDPEEGGDAGPRCFWFGHEYICPPNPTPTDPPSPTATPYIPPNCSLQPWLCDRPDPTATPRPTPVPPTNTPIPPTNTPIPPTNTPIPDTPTPVIIAIPPLNAPALSGRVSGTSLTLTWTEVTQADQYEVQERRVQCRTERGQQRCGEIWWLTVRSTTGLTETFSGLTVGRAYAYRVCSYRGIDRLTVCSGGQTWTIDPTATPIPESTPTETPVPTATPLPVPPAPSLTVTVPPPHSEIRVSWPAIAGVTIYKLAYGPTDGSENTTSDIYPPSTSASVGPGCGVTTYFKVRAYGDGIKYARAWGRWSASEDGTTGACQPTPGPSPTPVTCRDGARCPGPTSTPRPTPGDLAAPTGLTSRPHSTGKIVLEWDEVSGADVTYLVQQRRPGWLFSGPWRTLAYDTFTLDGSSNLNYIADTSVVVGNLDDEESYEHRVRSVRGGQFSDWSESLDAPLPLPHHGRQADHTVQYVWGSPALTPTPGGPAILLPRVVIPTAVAKAIDAWHADVTYSLPYVFICPVVQCAGRHDDGRRVIINIVNGNAEGNCGDFAACIRATDGPPKILGDRDGYVKNLEIRIEEPAFQFVPHEELATNLQYVWTNAPKLHRRIVPGMAALFQYLPMAMMHEFGHTLGLEELYLLDKSYPGYVMYKPPKDGVYTAVPQKDIEYVRQVYRNHTPQPIPPTNPRPH